MTKKKCHEIRIGTLYTQKQAPLYGRATSSLDPLCRQPDTQMHALGNTQTHAFWQSASFTLKYIIERHNTASKLINKILSKGELGWSIIFIKAPKHLNMPGFACINCQHCWAGVSHWNLPSLSADDVRSCSRPDAVVILPTDVSGIKPLARGCTPCWRQILWWHMIRAANSNRTAS